MSGASVPLRSPWFGEGLTSATTEDSGRNSDATIRAPPGTFAGAASTCARRKIRRQERRLCRNNATRQARARARALTPANPVRCRRDAPQKRRRPGRLVADGAIPVVGDPPAPLVVRAGGL